jgi:hypothetical protein
MEAVSLAEAWNTLPRLNRRLAASMIVPPEPARSRLRSVSTSAFARSAKWARRGVDVLCALDESGIRAAAFKGFAAMATVHGVPNRVIGDVDVLVTESDLPRAIACLGELGFRLEIPGALADYVEFVRHSPAFAGNLSVPVCDPQCGEIDLHWGLGLHGREFHIDRLLDRARKVQLFEKQVRVVAPADGLILAAHHIVRGNLAPGTTVKDLLDVESYAAFLQSNGELDQAVKRAVAAGALKGLMASTIILMRLDPESPAGPVHRRLELSARPGDRIDAERLADLFEIQVREGAIDKDVLYLLHPRSLAQIAGGFLGGWRRHLHWVEFLETKNAGHTASLGERIGTVINGLRRMSPQRVKLLRALARTKDHITR